MIAEVEPPKDPAEHASVVPVIPANLHKASIIIHSDGETKDNYISNIQEEFGRAGFKRSRKEKTGGVDSDDQVTFVQSAELPADHPAVVVTVSASVADRESSASARSTPEIDILAHL